MESFIICAPHQILFGRSDQMRWAGHVIDSRGDRRGAYRDLAGNPEGKRPLEDLGVDGMLMLKLIFKN
jgi:hypothetical protein